MANTTWDVFVRLSAGGPMEGTIGRIGAAVGGLEARVGALKGALSKGAGGGSGDRTLRQQVAAEERMARQAERDEARRTKEAERAMRRHAANEEKVMRRLEREEARRFRDAERLDRRRLREAERLELKRLREDAKRAKAQLDALKGSFEALSSRARGLGLGPFAGAMGKAGAYGGMAAGALGGFAMGSVLKGGIEANAQMEQMRNTIGTTLQLFNHNAKVLGDNTTAAEQFGANLEEAQKRMTELVTIANESPGGVEQIGELFQGMLPGARSITGDMDRIMGLTKQTTLLAAVLGNRFDLVGEQMSRALSGGAGQEMDTFRLLAPNIRQAGIELGAFKKNIGIGGKLTEAFNKLTGEQRFQVMERAMQSLGPEVAKHFGQSWDGVMGTAGSQLSTLGAKFTKPLYDGYLKFVQKAIADDGPLGGNKFTKLQEAATFFGEKLAGAAQGLFNWVIRATDYLVQNWERVGATLMGVAKALATAGTTMLALGAARGAFGAMAGAAGGMAEVGSTIWSIGKSLIAMGPAALILAPALVAIGAAMAGIAVLVGGTFAALIQNFSSIMDELRKAWDSGHTGMRFLMDAIDKLWGKLVAVGEKFLGTGTATDKVNTILALATKAVDMFTNALQWLMEFAAKSAAALATALRGADYAAFALDPTRWFGVSDDIFGYSQSVFGDMADAGDSLQKTLEDAAVAFREGKTDMDSFTESIMGFRRAANDNYWIGDTDEKKAQEAPMFMTKQGIYWGTKFTRRKQEEKTDQNTRPPKTTVNVKIVQNFKDQDPDMIVAAFQREWKRSVAAPLQSKFANRGRGRA